MFLKEKIHAMGVIRRKSSSKRESSDFYKATVKGKKSLQSKKIKKKKKEKKRKRIQSLRIKMADDESWKEQSTSQTIP